MHQQCLLYIYCIYKYLPYYKHTDTGVLKIQSGYTIFRGNHEESFFLEL